MNTDQMNWRTKNNDKWNETDRPRDMLVKYNTNYPLTDVVGYDDDTDNNIIIININTKYWC